MNDRGRQGERWVLPGLGRRQFLVGAAASAALVVAGCSSDGDGAGGGDEEVRTDDTTAATTPRVPELSADPFTLGVASGDPTTAAVILWTRLAPEPTADDGASGMPAEPADVAWEVAADEDFAEVIASGSFAATPEHGHSVHAEATGLEPATEYWYRFTIGDFTSPVGRTKTLPEGSPERFGLAVANCQMLEAGAYGAHRHLLAEDIDLVAFLGDYIYEYPAGDGGPEARKPLPNRVLETVGDYRLRYASYKLDEDLAAAHARFPWVCTWDDHEVANNYMGDTTPTEADPEVVEALKAAAYQAWWENMPTRLDPPDGPDLAIHQSFAIGDLASLFLLDQRQDSDVPPCRDSSTAGLDYGNCDEVDEDRTRLGAAQEAWFSEALGESAATWNLIGNPVVLAGIDAGINDSQYYLDTWDGYPEARKRFIAELATASNPVVLTGDYHAGMTLEVRATPFDQDSELVAPEFMAPPISSALFSADVTKRTPQLLEQINAHGYLVVDVTPERLTATFRTLDDVTDPDTAISTAATWQVEAGSPVPTQV